MADDGGVRVELLGPLRVRVDGEPVAVTAPRLRAVLAALALAAGRPVSTDALVEAVWGERRPRHPRASVHTYIGRLRRALGATAVVTEPAGFRLAVGPEDVDASAFTRLLDRSDDAAPADALRIVTAALALWRGDPLCDVAAPGLDRTEAALVERQLSAVERHAELSIGRGDGTDPLPRLRELAERHPLRESLHAALIATLSDRGRQAEALRWYERIRRRLAGELGVEPAERLRRVYRELLAGPAVAEPMTVPRQLPPAPPGLVGRDGAVAALDRLAAERRDGSAVAAITGTAGVGKTSLAIHWGHLRAAAYPDGQLYTDLRGFGPDPAVDPGEAVRGFLLALGIPADRVPENADDRFALYRSLTAPRRLLVVLDNAADTAGARPLLPTGPGCLALVTSRDRLTGLIVTEAATPVRVELLPTGAARRLLLDRLDPRRAADTEAVDALARLCAGLPLALSIVAARAALDSTRPLSTLVERLRDSRSRLASLDGGDAVSSARTVFSWSYRALDEPAARLFRLLSLHPTAEVSPAAAASLAGLSPGDTRQWAERLVAANLLTETGRGHYHCHDLLRRYARERAVAEDSPRDRHEAVRRLADHCLHTALVAMRLLQPQRSGLVVGRPADGVTVDPPADPDAALRWFGDHHRTLSAVARLAYRRGLDASAFPLVWAMRNYLDWQGHWRDWRDLLVLAADAAGRRGDWFAEISARRGLARVAIMQADYSGASAELDRALELATANRDIVEEAHTRQSIAIMFDHSGRYADGLAAGRRALALFEAAGHDRGIAVALNNIGWFNTLLGDPAAGIAYGERSLELHTRLGSEHGQAGALDSLGLAHRGLRHWDRAADCHRQAHDRYERLGDRHGAATALTHLAEVAADAGDRPEARRLWSRALDILDDLGHPDAAAVRETLRHTENS